MDRCDECSFTYEEHDPVSVSASLRTLGHRYRTVLVDQWFGTDGADSLTRRPAPGVWSPLEYGCHVRDVLLAQRERLFHALVEDEPSFVPIHREERAELARYADEAPDQVAAGIGFAAGLVVWSFDGVTDAGWQRTCIYNFPEPSRRSLLWLAQHTLHECVHHLFDIERLVGPAAG
jgi:hypothetical protein